MSGFKLLGYTIVKSQAEVEIRQLFEQYQKTLTDQKCKMCDDIADWRDATIDSIYKHANQQTYFLEQKYKKKLDTLNKACQQFVEELRVYEQFNNTEEVNKLLEQCQGLKIELAALEHNGQTIPFVEVPRTKRIVTNQDENEVVKNANLNCDNSSTVKHHKKADNNHNTHSNLHRNEAFTTNEQTDLQSSYTNSDDTHYQSTNSNDDQNSVDVTNANLPEKCPVCFMIFPTHMTASDRSKHAQGHYTDD